MLTQNWPPEYTVKRHRRAKSVKLRTSKTHGLEITIPYRFSLKHLPDVLEEHKEWIIKQLSGLQINKVDTLPDSIELFGIQKTWQIKYLPCSTKLKLMQRPDQELVIFGKIEDKDLIKKLLVQWSKKQAKEYLPFHLDLISRQTNLPFTKATIRDQRSVWGSCTSDKSISLNYKLIFLPPELMRYVMIHELCHTKHLNHSDKFWGLVEQFDPEWSLHRRRLKRGDELMPDWL